MLRDAAERARTAGARTVEERAIHGVPADALIELAEEVGADLLVVGSVGMTSMVGGSSARYRASSKRKAHTEVLVVETD